MKPGTMWAFFPVAILGMSVILHVVFITMAASDPTISVEENYYERGLAWDEERAQQARNRALGWQVAVTVNNAVLNQVQRVKHTGLDLALTDAGGKPLRGARVELEAFHHARASRVLKATPAAAEGGVYRAVLPMRRSGKWEIRLKVSRGDDVFTWRKQEYLLVRRGLPARRVVR